MTLFAWTLSWCRASLTGADDAVVTLGGLHLQLVLDHPAGGRHALGKAAPRLWGEDKDVPPFCAVYAILRPGTRCKRYQRHAKAHACKKRTRPGRVFGTELPITCSHMLARREQRVIMHGCVQLRAPPCTGRTLGSSSPPCAQSRGTCHCSKCSGSCRRRALACAVSKMHTGRYMQAHHITLYANHSCILTQALV